MSSRSRHLLKVCVQPLLGWLVIEDHRHAVVDRLKIIGAHDSLPAVSPLLPLSYPYVLATPDFQLIKGEAVRLSKFILPNR
jgi:hypothetical protein